MDRAAALDEGGYYPVDDMAALAASGLLAAVLPTSQGGLFEIDAASGVLLFRMLHVIGRGSLALGRLFEAHINALRLVMVYGNDAQRAATGNAARSGKVFSLWVTDAVDAPLRMTAEGGGAVLSGGKDFCSGAGHADVAVVTATDEVGGVRLLVLSLQGRGRVVPTDRRLQGMRAAVTGRVDFTGCWVGQDAVIGDAGDYLSEPEFSTGAWRSSAVALGGLSALVRLTAEQLIARQRDENPHQRARLGRMMMAHQTGYLWMMQAARLVCAERAPAAERVAYVNLARTAVESVCLDALQSVQRCLGLSAFVKANPVERISRDLATYLRQPAPDEALDEATAYFTAHAMTDMP